MRVLQLITRRQRRGAEVFACQLSDSLAALGHRVLLSGLYEPHGTPLQPSRAEVCDVGGTRRRPIHPATLRRLVTLVRSFQPDLVQANGSDTLKYGSLARRLSGGRWPLIYRNISMAGQWIRYPGQRVWGRWLLGAVDHVVAVSDVSRADFIRTYGTPESRITTIPIGVFVPERIDQDSSREAVARACGSDLGSAEILIHVGSHTPEKNHIWLIEAFDEIRRRRPGVHLVLLGDGPGRPEIEAAVKATGSESVVHILGSRADAAELVAGADLLLLPSLVEGIPGVILEASAQGVPSLAFDVGGIHEAVRHGETGFLVPPGEKEAFVDRALELLADPALRRAMGAAARAFVRREYSMEAITARFEALYRELLSDPVRA